MQLIDSHCHFDFDAFAPDRDLVWRRCKEAGVTQLIIPGVSIEQWPDLAALVQRESAWHAAIGVHPWWVSRLDVAPAELEQTICTEAAGRHFVAVGECGLDAATDAPMDLQLAVFRAQVLAACRLNLPLIVHVHKAHNETLRLLKELQPPRGGVIHAFSGSEQMAGDYWSLGFYLGIGGTITYERAAKTRRAVAAAPLESLLLESDAPDMPLAGRQGERNSPAYMPEVAETLAQLRGQSVEEIARQTRKNTQQLFAL
ncbi:TatD family hydrolase [Microbulbifer hainanensis]|uniref:TatD family hydrolase n=1 Tax=Microbulbifer hainanensis TaxID=2735675 RepID=UPI001869114B|nr:TatD family hydrolase [Microbulbifer hainanensis]